MIGDTSPRTLAEIHSRVETVRAVFFFKESYAQLEEVDYFIRRFLLGAFERSQVSVGGNHQVAWSVGIFIEDDEIVGAPVENVRVSVILCLESATEDASPHFQDFSDVFLSPGSGNVLHHLELIMFFKILLGLKYKTFFGGT